MSEPDRDALRPIVRELMLELLAEGVELPSSQATRVMKNPNKLEALRTKAIDLRMRELESAGGVPGTTCEIGTLGTIIKLGPDTISGAEWIALEAAIYDLPDDRRRLVVLDCVDVRKLGSLGVGRLIVLHDAVTEAGGMLAMINVTKPVAIVLQMMSVESVLHATPSGLDALMGGLDRAAGGTS